MYLSPVYREFYGILVDPHPRNLVLLPRGSFKSTGMAAAVMRDIVLNPNIRILYVSETLDLAAYYLGFVKRQFEGNSKFKDIFGDWKSKAGWGNKELWVAPRTDLSKKEATLTAKGIDQVRAGPHYDKIYVDDPVSISNSRTAAGLKLICDLYEALMYIAEDVVDESTGLLLHSTSVLLTGTRYDENDVYGHILLRNEAMKAKAARGDRGAKPYRVFIMPAETRDGQLPFGHLTREVLDEKKAHAPHLYPSQMLLDPVPPETALYQREDFRLIPRHEVPVRQQLYTYLLTDTATTEGREDFTVLAVIGKDSIGNAYVLDMLVKQMKPSEVVDGIFSLYVKWGCRKMLMEKIAVNECYAALIEARSIQTQVHIRIERVGGRTSDSKYNRIRALQGRFQSHNIWFSSELPRFLIRAEAGRCYGEIVDQFIKFPKSKLHDDIPDCLSDMDKLDNHGSPYCPNPPKQLVAGPLRKPTLINNQLANVQPLRQGGNFWGDLRAKMGRGLK